jgi:hypothetical protein
MLLELRKLPPLRGIYGPNKDKMPGRALYLAPDAAQALLHLESTCGGMTYSDIWRSAESSLSARQSGRGAQRPGYSGHNFGLSIDVAVDETCKRHGWTYSQLCARLAEVDWYCHRQDGMRGKEDWHFNFLGGAPNDLLYANAHDHNTWALPVEHAIVRRYGEQFNLAPAEQQRALQKLGLYQGDVDGQLGPRSRAAREAFERAWLCTGDDRQYLRTLAFVAAEVREV